jgi:hypothetical protein
MWGVAAKATGTPRAAMFVVRLIDPEMRLWWKTTSTPIANTIDLSTAKSKATGSCRESLGGATQQPQRQQHRQQKQVNNNSITTSSHSLSLSLSLARSLSISLPHYLYLSNYLSTITHSLYLCIYVASFLSINLSIHVFFFFSLPSISKYYFM